MIEDGRLNLDDKASDVVSNWPEERGNIEAENGNKYIEDRYKDISLRHLLNNTSGIQHYGTGRDDATTTQYGNITFKFVRSGDYTPAINGGWNANSSVEQFNKSILDFAPGSDYLYSSYGFNLAGAMIDAKISYGYDDWVIKYIKNHLGLKSFSMARHVSNRYGYEYRADGILKNVALADHDDVLPAGGWESTICDLATYTRALSKGELLKDGEALWRESNSTVINDKTKLTYGVGLMHRGTGKNLRVFHGGTNKGSRAYIHFFPKDTVGIVMLAPLRQANLERLAANLFEEMKLGPDIYTSKTTPLDTCHNGMASGKDLFIGVWKKTNQEQILRTGLDINEFRDEIRIMKDEYGYHLEDFEIHVTDDNIQIYDGVFKKDKKDQVLSTGRTVREILDDITRYRELGLEIIDIEFGLFDPTSDDISTNSSINALFEKGAPRSEFTLMYSQDDFFEQIETSGDRNLKIVDVEGHPHTNGTIWAGLFRKGTGNKIVFDTPIRFQRALKNGAYDHLGTLVDVDMTLRGDLPTARWVISIWEQNTLPVRTSYDNAKQPALDFCSFMDTHEANRDEGYELIDFDRIYTRVDN
jgi:CubicO group peptidase (beta-lactamase class C family)